MKKILTVILVIALTGVLFTGPARSEEGKNHLTAFLLSFAVPGLGQWYAGSPGSARLFIASELIALSGFYVTRVIKHSYGNDYLMYAANHAGVNPSGYGTDYLGALGAYDTSFDYNQAQEQKPGSPAVYTGPQEWDWDSYESRDRFKELRERELDYDNYATYCVTGIILNHFFAGLNASNLVRRSSGSDGRISARPDPEGIRMNYSWRF